MKEPRTSQVLMHGEARNARLPHGPFHAKYFQTGIGCFQIGTNVLSGNRELTRLTAALALLLPLTISAEDWPPWLRLTCFFNRLNLVFADANLTT